jgi:hypothetical protein
VEDSGHRLFLGHARVSLIQRALTPSRGFDIGSRRHAASLSDFSLYHAWHRVR